MSGMYGGGGRTSLPPKGAPGRGSGPGGTRRGTVQNGQPTEQLSPAEMEKKLAEHRWFMMEFRTRMCKQGSNCPTQKQCSWAHDSTQLRRRVIMNTAGKYNYSSARCKYYFKGEGHCAFGEQCSNAHNDSEIVYHPEIYKTRRCQHDIVDGYCKYFGRHCSKAHGDSDVREPHTNFPSEAGDQDPKRAAMAQKEQQLAQEQAHQQKNGATSSSTEGPGSIAPPPVGTTHNKPSMAGPGPIKAGPLPPGLSYAERVAAQAAAKAVSSQPLTGAAAAAEGTAPQSFCAAIERPPSATRSLTREDSDQSSRQSHPGSRSTSRAPGGPSMLGPSSGGSDNGEAIGMETPSSSAPAGAFDYRSALLAGSSSHQQSGAGASASTQPQAASGGGSDMQGSTSPPHSPPLSASSSTAAVLSDTSGADAYRMQNLQQNIMAISQSTGPASSSTRNGRSGSVASNSSTTSGGQTTAIGSGSGQPTHQQAAAQAAAQAAWGNAGVNGGPSGASKRPGMNGGVVGHGGMPDTSMMFGGGPGPGSAAPGSAAPGSGDGFGRSGASYFEQGNARGSRLDSGHLFSVFQRPGGGMRSSGGLSGGLLDDDDDRGHRGSIPATSAQQQQAQAQFNSQLAAAQERAAALEREVRMLRSCSACGMRDKRYATVCGHLFCENCAGTMMNTPEHTPQCSLCGAAVHRNEIFAVELTPSLRRVPYGYAPDNFRASYYEPSNRV
eukprot:Clim_evm15s238 gene=Clim_evmTU15s238